MAAINNKGPSGDAAAPNEPLKTPGKQAKAAPKPKKKTAKSTRFKPFIPTNDQRQIVMLTKAMGYSNDRICELIINPRSGKPVTDKTLTQHFPAELKHGQQTILAKVAGTLISIAMDKQHKGCVTAGIYLTKVWGRWREPEPEWSEKRRAEAEAKSDTGTGWTVVDAKPILEEAKPAQPQLPPPTTIQ